MNNPNDNRRAFHRIFFEAPVAVILESVSHKAILIDISLNGALITITDDWQPEIGQLVSLKIALGDAATMITMEATVSHIENNHLGLKLRHIDVDSASHLRRLVELNLGDSDMLHRDLEHLVAPDLIKT
jgi:hypothetical protein